MAEVAYPVSEQDIAALGHYLSRLRDDARHPDDRGNEL
jgi:cytochrome c553